MNTIETRGIAKRNGPDWFKVHVDRRIARRVPGVVGVCLVMMLASSLALVLIPGANASPTPFNSSVVKVSCGASIQSAINAAPPRSTIVLGPCTYSGALTIDKSVNIVGMGPGTTIITSPAMADPLTFGNPWAIVIGNAATVTLSGVTLLVTLQCIISSPYEAANNLPGYAGGGIGVGGSATLNLQSTVVTTTGQTEGGSCDGGAGFPSYGTGIGVGLDYVTGTPSANQLVGFGTVSGVTVSGFGFGGPDVAVGGTANSPAGSYALVSNDRISTIGNTLPSGTCPCAVGISVGFGGNASSATIVRNVLTGTPGTTYFPILIGPESYPSGTGSSAYIGYNWITGGGWGNGVGVFLSSSATITGNSIAESGTGPYYAGILLSTVGAVTITYNSITITGTTPWGIFLEFSTDVTIEFNSITGPAWGTGIAMEYSSATIESNSISQFHCVPAEAAPETCGPDWAYQAQGLGIWDVTDAGLGTTIANNLISNNDIGLMMWYGCSGCVENHNVFVNNQYYGLAGSDGAYTFSHDTVIGGEYGVAYIAYSANTTVTLSHVAIISPSVAPFYYENDCLTLWGYSCTDTIVGS